MRHRLAAGLCLCLALLAVGCFETKQDYTINADGSGKVVYEMAVQDMNPMAAMGMKPPDEKGADSPKASDQDIKKTAKQILDRSTGVEAWKDVSFSKADDGRTRFKGTAYFKDLSKLKLNPGGPSDISLAKDDKGGLVLNLEGESKDEGKPEAAPAAMSEDDIAKKIKEQRAGFQQAKPLMAAVLGTMKMELVFRLPGTVGEVSNFKKEADGSVKVMVEGAKLLDAMDKLSSDDAAMREVITKGESVSEGGKATSLLLNEKIFGQRGPVSVRMTGDLKPLFDYKAEVEAAKKDYPDMIKKLGLDQVKIDLPGEMPPGFGIEGKGEPGGGEKPRGDKPLGAKEETKPDAKPATPPSK